MPDLEILNYSRRWTNPEDFPSLSYTKDWNSSDDFPTIETDETQVRADMQFLYDEVRDYLNGALRSFFVGIGVPGTPREAENPAVRMTLSIGQGWRSDSGGGWSQTISVAGVTGNTRIDLRADAAARSALASYGVTAIWIENRAGDLTVRCLGATPSLPVTLQAELYETQPAVGTLNGVILGDAVSLGGTGGSGGGSGGGGTAVSPVAKTEEMTQPVGVDANGRLWTAPIDAVNVAEVGQ